MTSFHHFFCVSSSYVRLFLRPVVFLSLKLRLNYSKITTFDVVQFIVLFQLKCLLFELTSAVDSFHIPCISHAL